MESYEVVPRDTPVTKREVSEVHEYTEHAHVDVPEEVSNLEQEEARASWWKRNENSPGRILLLLAVIIVGLVITGLIFNWLHVAKNEVAKPAAAIKTNEPAAPSTKTPIVSAVTSVEYCRSFEVPQGYTVSQAAYEAYGNGRAPVFQVLLATLKLGPKDGNGPVGVPDPLKWRAGSTWSFPCELRLNGRTLKYNEARFAKKRDIATAQSEISASSNAALITPVQAANADVPSPETYAQATQPQTAQAAETFTTAGYGTVPDTALVHATDVTAGPVLKRQLEEHPEKFGFKNDEPVDAWATRTARDWEFRAGFRNYHNPNQVIAFQADEVALVATKDEATAKPQIEAWAREHDGPFKPKAVIHLNNPETPFGGDPKETSKLKPFEIVRTEVNP